ncbi:hypothetical protein GGX14DRAFT_587329, partial [Mycena pura]
MSHITFAYYCSGHGYGHATRVSALASHLLCLPEPDRPVVYIVSSAPKHVFADSVLLGAVYRNANIDPVIVQPLAYRVDRQRSVAVLNSFLDGKDEILDVETKWLREIHADCVLSDAAFIGCLAATAVGIPSILITNFTFDSVYSYLSTSLIDSPTTDDSRSELHFNALVPDIPVPLAELEPLVKHIHSGYRCADLLLRLPGYIPIPSFAIDPSLPSPEWVDPLTNRFRSSTFVSLNDSPASSTVYPSIEYDGISRRKPPRQIIPIPLLVRSPSSRIHTPAGRSKLLESIGVPSHLHDPTSTKILIVSFGGQVFRRPSRSGSATPSRRASRDLSTAQDQLGHLTSHVFNRLSLEGANASLGRLPCSDRSTSSFPHLKIPAALGSPQDPGFAMAPTRLATASHLWVPGAPPAAKTLTSPTSPARAGIAPAFQTIPPTPDQSDSTFNQPHFAFDGNPDGDIEDLPRLLPDASWIAIVCGVSKEQWNAEEDSDLPDGFFVAPRDVYMPDLTAVGDVLLGKLGYGTVSECVDACTPFVYVSRPLFIEEHGLRRLLDDEGVGVELSREQYEAGDWAGAIETAWQMGRAAKSSKRRDGESLRQREKEGGEVAAMILRWAEKW